MTFTLLLSFLFNPLSFAEDTTFLYCEIANQPQHSILRITMGETDPLELALRSPGEKNFRPMDMVIENVIGDFLTKKHSFLAKPNFQKEDVDWSLSPTCYVEVGTQWYFNFNYETQIYSVQLMPFFIQGDKSCMTERHKPQTKKLICF